MAEAKKIVHDGKRNALGIIFGPSHEDSEGDGPHEDDGYDGEDGHDGSEEDEKMALEEAFDALKKDDKEAFCEAMSSAMHICYMREEEKEDEEGGDGEEVEHKGKEEMNEY